MLKFLADNNAVRLDVVVKSLLSLSGSVYVSYGITIGAIIYGVREKILRRKTIKEMGDRIKNLESEQWKERTSSNINKDGTTPKEDL